MIRKLCNTILLCAAAITVCTGAARAQAKVAKDPKPAAEATPAKPQPGDQTEGQRIFEMNCSRCHATPEGFSSRISNTVVRHMRVRAGLSAHDEQALRRFFNP
ncbi:hypothetical protein GRAN_4853 [Granulicella sibirica]|uniref:Cytochrome c domain-containing protein n=1 Tax=Granulicella sibirica TaxID=2479048 RepID=A0A4Q0SV32_9BACT|nr:hypothetical protein GRAN_4853 [Granulicella sibirica]